MLRCPKCSSNNIATERRPDGKSKCLACNYEWKLGTFTTYDPAQSLVAMANKAEDAAFAPAPFPTFDVVKDPKEITGRLTAYKCHKIVNAARIVEILQRPTATDVLILEDPRIAVTTTWEWTSRHKVKAGGYLVVYDDGYISFSPQEAFERGYSKHQAIASPAPQPFQPKTGTVDADDPMNLSYFKPSAEGLQRIAELRRLYINVSRMIKAMCPGSREAQLALTHLEESCMYAVKSVVVHDPTSEKQKVE